MSKRKSSLRTRKLTIATSHLQDQIAMLLYAWKKVKQSEEIVDIKFPEITGKQIEIKYTVKEMIS